jgi:hypothetical protein
MKTEAIIHHLSSEAERFDRLAANAARRADTYRHRAEACTAAVESLGGHARNGKATRSHASRREG